MSGPPSKTGGARTARLGTLAQDRDDYVRAIGNQGVHPPREQTARVGLGIDGPDLHRESGVVRVVDEPRRDDPRRPRPLGNLITLVSPRLPRPPAPSAIQGPLHLLAGGAGRDGGLQSSRSPQDAPAK